MRAYPSGRAAWFLVAFALASACNDPDPIVKVEAEPAHDASLGGGGGMAQPPFPGSANPKCTAEEQRRLDRVLGAIGSLVTDDCTLPLIYDLDDNFRTPPLPDSGVSSGNKALFCEADPRRSWAEPPLPLPPVRLVFCPEVCGVVLQFYKCVARHSACRTALTDDEDAGAGENCFVPGR
jgi:hypothetical protein